jgi:hypothetical protein
MVSNRSGSVTQDVNNYDEPPGETGNRTQTDYAQQLSVKETRTQAFRDGTGRLPPPAPGYPEKPPKPMYKWTGNEP